MTTPNLQTATMVELCEWLQWNNRGNVVATDAIRCYYCGSSSDLRIDAADDAHCGACGTSYQTEGPLTLAEARESVAYQLANV